MQHERRDLPFAVVTPRSLDLVAIRRRPSRHVTPVAALRLRLAAVLVNLAIGIAAIAVPLGAGVGVAKLVGRRRRTDADATPHTHDAGTSPDPDAGAGQAMSAWQTRLDAIAQGRIARVATGFRRRLLGLLQSTRGQRALNAVAAMLALRHRERRSPGFRILGLRRVDVSTGDPPRREQELVRNVTRSSWQAFCRQALPPKKQRLAANDHLQAQLRIARERHPDDPRARHAEQARVYREHRIDPTRSSCMPVYLRIVLVGLIDLPLPWSPLKQSLPDRLAGLVVVERHRGQQTREAQRERIAGRLRRRSR